MLLDLCYKETMVQLMPEMRLAAAAAVVGCSFDLVAAVGTAN